MANPTSVSGIGLLLQLKKVKVLVSKDDDVHEKWMCFIQTSLKTLLKCPPHVQSTSDFQLELQISNPQILPKCFHQSTSHHLQECCHIPSTKMSHQLT